MQAHCTRRAHTAVVVTVLCIVCPVVVINQQLDYLSVYTLDHGTQGIAFVNHVVNNLDSAHRVHGTSIEVVYQ